MVDTSDMLSVLGTIFIAIIIISLFGSTEQKTQHTTVLRPTVVRPTRTVVRPTIIRPTRNPHHHHHGRRY